MKYALKTQRPKGTRFNLERDLNPEQRAVVTAPPGDLLVIAGAGTGKTRTLTFRVARLCLAGCAPDRILLCTFTNRAAREMCERVELLLGLDMRTCAAGTFHHIGNRILRRFGEPLGIGAEFGILDPEDARTMLAQVIAELGLKALTARRFPQPRLLSGFIGLAAGTQTTLRELIKNRATHLVPQLPAIEDVAMRYAERKRQHNLCDFDDLLIHWHRLLREPEFNATAAELQQQYDHVLVDEYQDINALQGSICDAMAERSGSLTCVGDDAQSIYGFRGADFDQMAHFERRHPNTTVLKLTTNYRSTPEILELCNRTIAANKSGHAKHLRSVKRPGMVPAVIPLRDVYQQAEFVAQRLLEVHHEQGLPLRKMAVLYRNHSHSVELQVELTRRQIPYAIRSGVRFFEQAHIKDVVSYLRARDNQRDGLAWVRLLKQWPGVGTRTAETLATEVGQLDDPEEVTAVVLTHAGNAKGRTQVALQQFAALWARLQEPEQRSPGPAIREIVDAHYGEYADRCFTNATVRKEDLRHLAGYADRYDAASSFLAELALVQGLAAENVVAAATSDDPVVLSTVHQAKGLEWPVCFVLSLADGRFPSAQALRTPREIEEERRLFYVACTRAADELYLLYPTIEEGKDGPSRLLRPSRFLSEIDRSPVVFERWQILEEAAD